MDYSARHRFARMSATKVRPVARTLKGLSVGIALENLKYLPHRSARLIEKVLKSAQANAEEQGVRNPEELIVREVRIDQGPAMKRVFPRCRGMAHIIRKRMCHISIRVTEDWD